MSLFCLFFLIGIGNGEFYIFENVRYSSTRTWKLTKTKDRCHVIIKWGHVEPHTVFPLFATCRTELYTARCQFVFSEIDVMHCQWAHFTLYQLSWWRISNWPVFPKLNFPSWRLSRNQLLVFSRCHQTAACMCLAAAEHSYFIYPNSPDLGSWQAW